MTPVLPLGKIPHALLERIIQAAPTQGSRILLGPGVGLDCAVLDFGDSCLVLKTEPITFASEEIGWYAVQIAANDIATTGAVPAWAMFTVLLPESTTTEDKVLTLSHQISDACHKAGIAIIGGHTEITHNLDRPIIVTTLIGEVPREKLITPAQACPGDVLILTKGVPIEGAALLAREFPEVLKNHLTPADLKAAQNFLYDPGISVRIDAQTALQAGSVTAMHDPTEGGVATALWEMAHASQKTLIVDTAQIPIPPLAGKICKIFGLDPLGTIASGSLLLTVSPGSKNAVLSALKAAYIDAAVIGEVAEGEPVVLVRGCAETTLLQRFDRDEIGRVYEKYSPARD